MPNVIQVIVNADDLGMSTDVNEATFRLIDQGKITSATMLANAPSIEDAFQRIGNFRSCSFGVHLNITQFKPLTGPDGLRRILNENGMFIGYDKIRDGIRDSELKDSVYSEFCAQIDACKSAGIEISHIDSHHHVHTIPWIFFILKKVQRKFNIRRVRLTKNLYRPKEPTSRQIRLKKAVYNFLLRRYVKTATTDAFADFQTFYECATSSMLRTETLEAMVHPGNVEYEGSQEEIDLLQTPWEQQLQFPVTLINYNNLPSR